MTLLVVGLGMLAPTIPKLIDANIWRKYSLFEITNPFHRRDGAFPGPVLLAD